MDIEFLIIFLLFLFYCSIFSNIDLVTLFWRLGYTNFNNQLLNS